MPREPAHEPRGAPAVADQVLQGLEKDTTGQWHLDPTVLARIVSQAEALTNGEELYATIGELLRVAVFMRERHKAPAVAEAILGTLDGLATQLAKLAAHEGQAAEHRAAQVSQKLTEERRALKGRSNGMQPPTRGGVGLRTKR